MRNVILSTLLVLAAAPAGATLIGDSIDAVLLFPDRSTVSNSTTVSVTADATDTFQFGGILVDPNALSVTFTKAAGDAPFAIGSGSDPCNCVRLTSLDIGFAITGFQIDVLPSGLTLSDIETTASSLLVDLQGVTMAEGTAFTVTLIPEPGSAALLALGLAGLLAAQRRRA